MVKTKSSCTNIPDWVTLFKVMAGWAVPSNKKVACVIPGISIECKGEPLSLPPYGYMKDPDNPKQWIIDEEAAAEVVRRIFDMTLDGKGTEQIAAAPSEDRILSPIFYWRSKGLNRGGSVGDREPHR